MAGSCEKANDWDRSQNKRLKKARQAYMVRPAMQEEISVNMKGKLQSYIRHLFENP